MLTRWPWVRLIYGALLGSIVLLLSITGSGSPRVARVASEPPVPTGSVNVTVVINPSTASGAPVLDLNSLTFAQASVFIQGIAEGSVIEVPVGSAAGIEDLYIDATFEVDAATGSATFVGVSELSPGVSAAVLLTALWGGTASPDIVIGVAAQSFSLSELGFNGPFSDQVFPDSVFLVSVLGPGETLAVSSTDVSPAALSFLQDSYPGPGGFSLELANGVNFATSLPLSVLPAPLLELVGADASDDVLIEGSAGLNFGLLTGDAGAVLTDLALVATLPPFAPVLLPDWIAPAGADPQISITYDGTSTVLTITGGFAVNADGTPLTFDVLSELNLSATESDFQLDAWMTAPWVSPFDVSWLTLQTAQLKIKSQPGGGFTATLDSGLEIGVPPDTVTLALTIAITGSSGALDAEMTATSNEVLSTSDLLDFLANQVGVTLPPGIPSLDLTGVTISVGAGSGGTSLSVSANAQFLGVEAEVLFSVKDPDGAGPAEPELIHGINLPSVQLSDLGVPFPGTIGSFSFPELAFVVADVGPVAPGEGGRGIPSAELSPAERSFFNRAYGIPDDLPSPPDFTINLQPGLNLAGSIPLSVLPAAVLDAIGSPSGDVILEGSIVLDIGIGTNPSVDLVSLGLKAQLPGGVTIPGVPDWLTPATGLSIEIGYDASGPSPEVTLGVSGDFGATLDAQTLVFDLSLQLVSGDASSVEIRGVTNDSWDQPFGVSWLTLTGIDALLSADSSGSFSTTLSSSFVVGGKTFSLALDVTGSAGALDADITATADSLSTSDVLALLNRAGLDVGGLSLPEITVTNVQVAIVGGTSGIGFSLGGTTNVLEAPAQLLISVIARTGPGGLTPQVVAGIQMTDFSMSSLVPDLSGTLAGDLTLDSLALAISIGDAEFASGDLPLPVFTFYRQVYGTDDFTLKVSSGISLIASVPLPADGIGAALDALGSGGQPALLSGTIPAPWGGGGLGVSLRAELPPMSPTLPDGSSPPWFESGQLSLFIEVSTTGVSIGIEGALNVIIDESVITGIPNDKTPLTFLVSAEFTGTPSSIAFTLKGALTTGPDTPWESPFGIEWLTIRGLGVGLSFNLATLGLGLGLTGDADIGGKNLEVAISLSLNVASGVPTNFVFRGASNTSFGISDLVSLAELIADAPGSIPSDQIPNIELRPVDVNTPIEIKFAVFTDPITDTAAGLALSGALWARLQPGGALEEVGAVDVKIGIGDPFGIFIFGSISQEISVGGLTLSNPLIDIDLSVLPPGASFILTGDLTTPWFAKRIDIVLDSDVLLADAFQTLAEAQAAWDAFVVAFEDDPVNAIQTVLIAPGGVFDILGVPPPPWVADLFDAVTQAAALGGSVSKQQLMEYALNGFDVTIPAFDGFPAGGVNDLGCRLLETEHTDGRCYTLLPFPGVEQGFDPVLVCDLGIPEAGECWIIPPGVTTPVSHVDGCTFGILEGGRCWLVPPSTLFSTGKISVTTTSLHCHEKFAGICVDVHVHSQTVQRCPITHPFEFEGLCYSPAKPTLSGGTVAAVCPFGSVESNGTCYTIIPGPPVKTSGTPYIEQRCLFPGQIENGKCWEFLNTPHPGLPAGGNDPRCPVLNPFYASGKCWTVPPLPEPQAIHFDGVCGVLGIACTPGGLRDGTISELIASAVQDLLSPFQAEEVGNSPPDAHAGGPYNVEEGGSVVLSATGSGDPDGDALSFAWDFDNDGQFDDATGPTPTFLANTVDGPSTRTVRVRVSDGDLGDTAAGTITVQNVAPILTIAGPAVIAEGSTYVLQLASSDPGPDTITNWQIDWGDGTVSTVSGNPSSATHIYTGSVPGPTVSAAATDEDGTYSSNSFAITVTNAAPVITATGGTVNEGGAATVSGSVSDPGPGDTLTVTIDWGNGPPTVLNLPAGASTYSANRVFADDDPTGTASDSYNVAVTVEDGEGGVGTANTTVTVNNVVPTITATGPKAAEVSLASVTGTLQDPGIFDTFEIKIDWGDGTPQSTQSLSAGVTTFSGNHTYANDGIFTVQVTAVDDDTGASTAITTAIIVNVAPALQDPVGSGDGIDEGQDFTVAGNFNDPGVLDSFTVRIDWGDGESTVLVLPAGANSYEASHHYPDDNPTGTDSDQYLIDVTVTDDGGGSDTASTEVLVSNIAPTTTATGDTILENGTATLTGTIADPGVEDTFTLSIDWGDGEIETIALPAGSTSYEASHQYLDDDPAGTAIDEYTVVVIAIDDDGGEGAVETTVTVENVAPTVSPGPDQQIDEGDVVSLSPATFADAGILDTHTATIDWGDGTPVEPGLVTETGGSGTVSANHVYADNGSYIVTVCVLDDDLGRGCDELTVHVSNVAPAVDAGADQSADEGEVVNLAPAFNDAGASDTHTATIDWGDGTPVEAGVVTESPFGPPGATTGADGTISGSHVYADNGTYAVLVCVEDDDSAKSCDQMTVIVQNIAPVIIAIGDAVIENGTATVTGTIDDPGAADTFTLAIDWGEGEPESFELPAGSTDFTVSHQYLDDNPSGTAADDYMVVLSVSDDDGGGGSDDTVVTVSNVVPQIDAISLTPSVIFEGEVASLEIHFGDVGTLDTQTVTVDWGDGTIETIESAVSPVIASHLYVDDNPSGTASDTYTVTVTVQDDDLGEASTAALITVANANPVLGAVSAPNEPVPVGTPVAAQASFTDLGLADTHTAVIDWGDGGTSADVVSYGSPGHGLVSGVHTYLSAGVYLITITLTDDDSGSDETIYRYVVVYDTSAGFATGGGWTVPGEAGNSNPDDSLPGIDGASKANFGFTIKYKNNSTTPVGQLQFNYHGSEFSLHVSEFQWLVITGGVAQFQGSATIDGLEGEFTVRLTTVDNGSSDRFEMRIWAQGSSPNVDPPLYQASGDLGGGQVKVHEG